MDLDEIKKQLREYLKIRPASIHYDIDEKGNVSARIEGMASDVRMLVTLICQDVIKTDDMMTIDGFCDSLRRALKMEEKKDKCNAEDKFKEIFKDLEL